DRAFVCLQNNTFWKPDSCQECRCHSDDVICEPVICRYPQCDFQKGEVLQIPPNACCPECASGTEGFCQHEGQTHAHGTEWAHTECTTCSCASGKVNCTPKSCPPLYCGRGELAYIAEGKCCPTCVGTGESCSFDGQIYRDGEEWRLNQCSKCVCSNGTSQCFTAECQPVLCTLAVPPGKCCPECVPKPCSVSEKVYEHAEQWKKNVCTTCVCDRGEARCVKQACVPHTCDKYQCCEECVSSKESCLYEGTIRYHSEMWKGPRCEFCTCDGGRVTCWNSECAKVECALVRKGFLFKNIMVTS
uniref:VWFC domain-containing protein n=1 Tax=Pelusios castaneus TaxID=367368 RepID=A0A8C8VGV1_9SAUR